MNYCTYASPLGRILLTEENEALTGLYFEGQRFYPSLPDPAMETGSPLLRKAEDWLTAYFNGENEAVSFPLAPKGSAFRQTVWAKLLTIPYGETTTYGAIAKELHTSARAVGGAVGHNPISILIPCHRVLSADGSLGGYAGGIERKEYLLKLEARKWIP